MPLNWILSAAMARRTAMVVRAAGSLPAKRLPIIYVPGILGVELRERVSGKTVWGDYRGILFPSPNQPSFALENEGPLVPGAPLHHFTIVPKLLDTLVTAELRDTLEESLGYREGRDLFFLSYDWRESYETLAENLTAEIARIRAEHGATQQVILLGQSAANLAIRHLVRAGPAWVRDSIAKWYAFGPIWKGTYNALKLMSEGYYPATRRFHGFSPADILSYPGAYQLLPHDGSIVDVRGRASSIDFLKAECWADHGFGPTGLKTGWKKQSPRLRAHLRQAASLREPVSGQHPRDRSVRQTWFAGCHNRAVVKAVGGHGRDLGRALVTEHAIKKQAPALVETALAEGDDHIPLAHISADAPGPLVRSSDAIPYGEDYVFVGHAKDHRAIINHRPTLTALALDIAAVHR